jgi:N-methylhydantoinase A/oxoprolinase/acetone carboxylase beta subunit
MRPIETILSGPAASLVGARHLTGLDDAIVSDIGGTTTDIAVLAGGRPKLDPDGATVGGMRTMVEAVAMRTHGLGGDSEVRIEEGRLEAGLLLGPRRLVPLSLAAHLHGRSVTDELQRQLRAPNSGRLDGRFVLRTGVPAAQAEGLDAGQARLMTEIADTPRALDTVLTSSAQGSTLDRLVARGLVQICGFTPSDAAHVAGRQSNWDREAAELGAALMARRRDGRGKPVAPDGESFSHRVLDAVARRSAELVLESALAEDGFDAIPTIAGPLVQRALDGKAGIARLALSLDRPVVGLGASAGLHYARLDALLATPCIVPKDADVANALGAVVGQVRVSAIVSITQPSDGQYRLVTPDGTEDMANEDAAFARAAEIAARGAQDRAREAGADEARIEIVRDVRRAEVEGRPMLVEASVTAFASGRPRIAAIDQAR